MSGLKLLAFVISSLFDVFAMFWVVMRQLVKRLGQPFLKADPTVTLARPGCHFEFYTKNFPFTCSHIIKVQTYIFKNIQTLPKR